MSVTAQRAVLLTGPVMVVFLAVGWGLCAGWLPPPGPGDSSEQVAQMYVDHRFGLQMGFVLMVFAATFFGVWGCALSMWTRPTEARFPILTHVQLAMLGGCTAIFVILYVPWALAAFRAGTWDPEMIHMLHELGWFMFFFAVAPFTVWMIAVGLGILWTPNEQQVLPRWVGFYSVAEGFMILPAILTAFFYEGPFSYNGALGIWWPLTSFFFWVPTMTVMCWKAVDRQAAADEAAGIGVHRDAREITPPRPGVDAARNGHGDASSVDDELIGAR